MEGRLGPSTRVVLSKQVWNVSNSGGLWGVHICWLYPIQEDEAGFQGDSSDCFPLIEPLHIELHAQALLNFIFETGSY